jgi:hypothetical protein
LLVKEIGMVEVEMQQHREKHIQEEDGLDEQATEELHEGQGENSDDKTDDEDYHPDTSDANDEDIRPAKRRKALVCVDIVPRGSAAQISRPGRAALAARKRTRAGTVEGRGVQGEEDGVIRCI